MDSIDKWKEQDGSIARENIKKIIPYEDPFLLIDEVKALTQKEIIATKTVKESEEYLKGHFVDFPIMPGALLVEGLGQAATLLVRYNLPNHENYDILAYKIRSAKFFRPTFIGHEVTFKATKLFMFKKIAYVNGIITRKDKVVSKVNMVLAIVDRQKFRGHYQKPKPSEQ